MFLIEGVDGSGKTTLAKVLSAKNGSEVIHFGIPEVTPYNQYVRTLLNARGPIIIDRMHVSEYVYSWLTGREMQLTRRHYRTLDLMLQTLGTVSVLVTADPQVIKNRLASVGGDDVLNEHEVDTVSEMFGFFVRSFSRCRWQFYHSDVVDVVDFADELKRVSLSYMSGLPFELRHQLLYQYNLIGEPVDPDFLLVGERVNIPARSRQNPMPFDLNASSDLLIGAMDHLNKTFAIVNTMKPRGELVDLRRVVTLTSPKIVLALGAEASHRLSHHNIEHKVVTHPGHAKRFGRNVSSFVDEIKERIV